MINYIMPQNWIKYDITTISNALIEAKAAVLSLKSMPYKRAWVDGLQNMELKREVAGTSRIEGADFTDRELDEALKENSEQLKTRSQHQAHAAQEAYRWIATLQNDKLIDGELIKEIHRKIITGADDDICPPGRIRAQDENVNFGQPRHRGVTGGGECEDAFNAYITAIQGEFRGHDPIIQALAAHYHFAAIHPFLDGNGRTARALESLLLQRAGMHDVCFIAMSNYYYEEKMNYLKALAQARSMNHDITPFLLFALKGIATQNQRVLDMIKLHVSKELFQNLINDLFDRLMTPRKRVIADRQKAILNYLLNKEEVDLDVLIDDLVHFYEGLQNPVKAISRDLWGLKELQAIKFDRPSDDEFVITILLDWPTKATVQEFLKTLKNLPKAKTSIKLKNV